MSASVEAMCLRCGWLGGRNVAKCPDCDSIGMARVSKDAVIGLPAGSLACPRCGRLDEPITFRGGTRLLSLIVWVRELRVGAYLCPACARRFTATNLAFTGVLGWWAISSLLFYAPRATYQNWRAVWAAPRNALRWGAIRASDLAGSIREGHEHARVDWSEEDFADSPLGVLSERQRDVVFAAEGLYETLGVIPAAPLGEVRAAYVRKAKMHHPDVRPGDTSGSETMVRLNLAWEIIRDANLRAAYDWLSEQRAHTAV